MNFIKKALIAIACVGMFGSAAQAAPINLSPVSYDAVPNTYISGSTTALFTLNIKDIANGFRVGVDTLNSAVLSIIFRDDDITDGNETYKVLFGTSAQTFTGSGLSNGCFAFFCGASSITEEINLNLASLADLKADGLINIAVSTNNGDFNFDKATLVANVTRGTVPEPTTVALLGLGLLGFAASRRKAAKSKNA